MYIAKTIRLDDKLLKEIKKIAKGLNIDISTYIRKLIQKGYEQILIENSMNDYIKGKISISEAAENAHLTIWEFIDLLKHNNADINIDLTDWYLAAEI